MALVMGVTPSGLIEKYYPLLNLVLPRNLADKHREMLKRNEQRLIGQIDVRKTMFALAGKGDPEMRGYNILTEEIPENRNPGQIDVEK